MTTQDFIHAVEAIAAQRPSYREGGDGSDGTCDCIGLIIGAMQRCGVDWTGLHGSNWAARNAVSDLHNANEYSIGDLAFKTRLPLDPDYDLPKRYANDADQTDYYHVGVVTSVDPLRITHCTTPGIQVDVSSYNWDCFGTLSALAKTVKKVVMAVSGSTVNLRRAPGGALLARIPVGTEVTVEAERGDWSRLRCDGRTGWMLTKYLQSGESTDRLSELEQIVAELSKRVEELEAIR